MFHQSDLRMIQISEKSSLTVEIYVRGYEPVKIQLAIPIVNNVHCQQCHETCRIGIYEHT
jgi:hypothetical protein